VLLLCVSSCLFLLKRSGHSRLHWYRRNAISPAKKLDVVGIAGAAFSDIHAPAGRSCARSRPMRIFAIAVRDYDSSIA
jgi:hypothetical protein